MLGFSSRSAPRDPEEDRAKEIESRADAMRRVEALDVRVDVLTRRMANEQKKTQ